MDKIKIAILGSMTHYSKMKELEKKLTEFGIIPEAPFFDETANYDNWDCEEATRIKLKNDILKSNFEFVKRNDAVLVLNEEKNGIKNYIGGNTFLEMGFAHVLNKKIFLLNGIPELSYTSEINAMKPICLNGNIEKIKGFL